MFDDLDKLIVFIDQEYGKLYKKWKKSSLYVPINQKKNLVKDIKEDNIVLKSILNYRQFVNENHLGFKMSLNKLLLNSEINSRVKSLNSIEYKINNYMSAKHNYGEIPINKCFNDIYGIRIIFEDNITYNEIKDFVESRYNSKLKCIDSSKGKYVATHIYFKNDIFSYQWELQIWDKSHEEINIKSHEAYKQDYTKWEKENKGGESI